MLSRVNRSTLLELRSQNMSPQTKWSTRQNSAILAMFRSVTHQNAQLICKLSVLVCVHSTNELRAVRLRSAGAAKLVFACIRYGSDTGLRIRFGRVRTWRMKRL